MDDLTGRRLSGKYELLERVEAGLRGSAYRARELSGSQREVTIKTIPTQSGIRAPVRERFEEERRSLASFEHPCFLPTLDYGEDSGVTYVVRPFLRGSTLRERLDSQALSFRQTFEILEALAEALDGAHSQGLFHRDVQPSNVILHERGRVCLAEFGTALLLAAPGSSPQELVPGTPDYLSPELVFGDDPSEKSDQYSLAVMAYEMLAGQRPFRGDTARQVAAQHARASIPFEAQVFDRFPALCDVLRRALAKQPAARFQSCKDLVRELHTAINAPPQPDARAPTAPASLPAPERRRASLTLVALLVAALAVLGLVSWLLAT